MRENTGMTKVRYARLVCGLLLFLLCPNLWAQETVGLLLERVGHTVPDVSVFSEFPAEFELTLAKETSIQFLHYGKCEEVTVTGGRVVLHALTYQIEGGLSKSRALPCPREQIVDRSGLPISLTIWEPGSVRIRGLEDDTSIEGVQLSVRSRVILIGEGANEFSAVRLIREGKSLVDIPLQSSSFRWPAVSLEHNAAYEMVFVPNEATRSPLRVTFRMAPATDFGHEGVVLVHVGKAGRVESAE